MIDRTDVTGVILCGGEGKRWGGREKPLELLNGLPLVSLVRSRLAPQVGSILISANRRVQEYSAWGDGVVADTVPGLGPLGGLTSALEQVTTEFVFCCPGDAPFLPATLVARLGNGLLGAPAEAAVPHDGERQQSLFLLFRTSLASSLRQFLDSGGRAAHAWIASLTTAVVDASVEREQFANINSEADLMRLGSVHARTAP